MPATEGFQRTVDSFTEGATTLPREYFVSASIFAQEQSHIFDRHWLCLGHVGQLPQPGDFFLAPLGNESLIVVRGRNHQLRAFYNVCRHRGTRLCETDHGHFSAIQCPYHAWTYSLQGDLTGAPQMDESESFRKANYGLHQASLGLWEGLIFASLSTNPRSLDEYFRPLLGKFSHWQLDRLRSARRITYDVAANWKLIFENYSECYHCPLVHPALQKMTPSDLAENDLTEGPFLGGFMPITNGRSLTMSGGSCARSAGDVRHEDHSRVFYYSIFPNVLLSMHPDYVMVHQLRPEAPDRTQVHCDWYFHPQASEDENFHPEDAIEFWDMTNRQDWHVCELSQKGIGSRAYTPGPYSPRESIPAAWDREYLRQLGSLDLQKI